jgi:hypothetical protein
MQLSQPARTLHKMEAQRPGEFQCPGVVVALRSDKVPLGKPASVVVRASMISPVLPGIAE